VIKIPSAQRLKSLATGFAGVHSLNAGLNMAYALAQTLVFARVLDHRTFALTILAQTFAFYLLPLNQSVARANFVVLRERAVRTADARAPEAAVAFNVNQILLLVIPVVAPMALGTTSAAEYGSFVCFLFFVTYSNIWYFEIQMSMMAVDRALDYERISFIRRVIGYVLLCLLFVYHNFYLFNILVAIHTVVFHFIITSVVAKGSGLFKWPQDVTVRALRAHLVRLWVSLQATVAEWLTLNAPYAIFLARFGVGPGLVTIDAILKLLRIVVSVTRNLAEIALPRVSRALLLGDTRSGRMSAILALAGGGLGALTIAVVVAIWERWSFGLLLGPNNVVPHGAGAPAALALMAGVGIATGGHFIGHSGEHRSIPILSVVSVLAVGLLAAYTLVERPSIVNTLWAAAICMTAISATALALLVNMLRR
jgi:hypothetical protein